MKAYIIAEAGVNHNGDIKLAYELIDAAAQAGCDCVKFQTFRAEKLVTETAPQAEYQIQNIGKKSSQYEMLKKLEFTFEQFAQLKAYCEKKGIDFLSTPFDEESADMLYELGVKCFKFSSGDITNKPFLQYVAQKNLPMILSTGMCTLDEVKEAVSWVEESGNKQITLLHCTSNYPTPYQDVNMAAMQTLKDTFEYPVGYSDHTQGIVIPVMAAAMGAVVIEKHFTLDRNMEGPDHKASLEPSELAVMVKEIRIVESAMGTGEKKPCESELGTRDVARKSLVYATDVAAGEVITSKMLTVKRPGTGIAPKYFGEMIGKKPVRDVKKDELADWKDLET